MAAYVQMNEHISSKNKKGTKSLSGPQTLKMTEGRKLFFQTYNTDLLTMRDELL